ncbi:MAG: error-prone DNA polymerase [Planctomycetota bacterium]|nr:error-prone DNA polymerase [Planctomycetota bacterium]
MPPPYVPLWCKSNFSFLEGASHPEELVEACERLGVEALALTDRDGVHGVVEAHVRARELGVRLIIGSEVTLEDDSTIVLLATNRRGYANLCRLITRGRRRSPKGESVVTWEEVCAHAEDLIALWGGERSLLVGVVEPLFVARNLRDAFGDRLYALAARHRRAEEVREEARLRERAERHGLPVVAAAEILYHQGARRDLQDVLTCIRHGVTLSTAGRLTKSNAEHALKSPHAFERLFSGDPAAVARTREVASRSTFSLDEIRYRYPSEKLPDGTTSSGWLRRLTYDGAAERFSGRIPRAMREQIDKELALIDELDYCGYFLTMWEIVRFCREQGILCQGRGSAANSAVCYSLGITAVDPVQMGLLFERFLSRERAEPPDIDLDIEHVRREEVIQHVYEKYGRSHAAMVANFIRYRSRSAVRDVGKALGLAETALDRLARLLSPYEPVTPEALSRAGLDPDLPAHGHLLRLTGEITDFPRHLSIHPGGFLLGHEPVSDLVPIENASMPERTVIQWNKDGLEELGLFKVDLLGLGALTQLHLGFDLLRQHHGKELSMASIPAGDRATFDRICRADTVGVFQIESRAQMAMLPRLKPRTYYDLVIEVSIVRPGPITGGMVHPYLRRRNGEEPVVYPHESLEPVLAKTLGVPLFQEQVMRLAVVAADYTPGEADQLRRDMAAWRKTGRIERHRERLVNRMERKGIPREFAERVFEQIRGFGEYGFPESHAASFALIAYAGAWMKCHYPEVFTCSLLNALPMGFYSAATIVDDAKRHGVEVRPIDVLRSDWDSTLEPATAGKRPFAVRLGFRFIKGLRQASWQRIARARTERPFSSAEDLEGRTGLDDGTLVRLAESGALDGLEENRRQALWSVKGLAATERPALELSAVEKQPDLPGLDAFEDVTWDYSTTGLSPRSHPLALLRDEFRRRGLPDARALNRLRDGERVRYAGVVICRQRPGTASGVVFMTLEDETGFVNLVIWSRVFEENAVLLKTTSFLGVTGKLQIKDGVTHVIAEAFWTPRLRNRPSEAKSRDFR